MGRRLSLLLICCWGLVVAASTLDWLRDDSTSATASLQPSDPLAGRIQNSSYLYSLGNTLLSRVFATTTDGGWGTWDIWTVTDGSALRALSPEAIVKLDNIAYNIGITLTPLCIHIVLTLLI